MKTGKKLSALVLALALLLPLSTAPAQAETEAVGPQLLLTQGETLDWPCGVPFEEPGFQALDAEGTDRSGDVTVEGRVKVWRTGEYVLRYVLPQEDGTVIEAQRTVHVVPQALPESIQPPKGTICLTFDDGPCANTEEALDILDRYGVKATFFIVANQTKYLDLLPEIVKRGHTLGIHCYDHTSYGYLYRDEETYFADLLAAQKVVYEKTGEYAHVLRFPGGSRTASYLAGTLPGGYDELYTLLHDMGMRAYDWNVQPESSTKTTEGTIIDFTHPREPYDYAVVLQHDARLFSVRALEKMIQWAISEGYTFASLDETCPEVHFY